MLLLVPALLIPLITVSASAPSRSDYIVTLRPGPAVGTAVKGLGAKLGITAHHLYRHALRGFSAKLSQAQVVALRADARVRTIQPDRSVKALDEALPTGVDREQSDQSSTRSGDGKGSVNIDVAVIDTGIDTHHPDLNVVGGTNCSDGGPKNYTDGNGHGTHVAGIMAAKDDSTAVVGVAPGARLWAVRVLDKNGSGMFSSVICGIDWVAGHAATVKVANMSLGGFATRGSCTDGSMRQAICSATAAGVTFVVAAGNSGMDFGGSSGFAAFVPASFPEVLTVTAMANFNGQPGGGAPPPAGLTWTIRMPTSATTRSLTKTQSTRSPCPECASCPPGWVAATTRSAARAWPHRTLRARRRCASRPADVRAARPR